MIYGIVLLVMLAAMLAIGIPQALKAKTATDFLVAGRQLSTPVMVATLLCSWIGAGSLFAGAEFAFKEGLASLWMPAGGWAGLIIIYFLAGRVRKFSQFTIPDLLETRYGAGARVMGTLCIIVSYTAIVSYQFKAGGRVLQLAFGIEEGQGMLIVAGFVIVFTAMAGMSSVAYVDLVAGTVVTIGCLLMFPALLNSAGGWSEVQRSLPESHFTLLGTMSVVKALSYFLTVFMLLLGNQSMYQKFFSARSERTARLSVVGWMSGTLFLEIAIVLLAIVGGTLAREHIEQGSLPPWGIIPYAARYGVISWVGAFFLGAVFAKIISTGNNYLFSPATNVVHDIYQRFIDRQANDRAILIASRATVVFLGILAYFQAFQSSILETAVYAYDVYGAGITPVVLAAFFWKRATPSGGLASILAGTFISVIWKVFGTFAPEKGPASNILENLGLWVRDFPMIFPALAMSLICLVLVSLLTAPPERKRWEPFFDSCENKGD